MLRNLGAKAVKGYSLTYSVYQNKLYSDEIVGQVGKPVVSETFVLDKDASRNVSTRFEIAGARLWSAEEPNRYTLVAELKDKKVRPSILYLLILAFARWRYAIRRLRTMSSV